MVILVAEKWERMTKYTFAWQTSFWKPGFPPFRVLEIVKNLWVGKA